jgi:hypothetical protein
VIENTPIVFVLPGFFIKPTLKEKFCDKIFAAEPFNCDIINLFYKILTEVVGVVLNPIPDMLIDESADGKIIYEGKVI